MLEDAVNGLQLKPGDVCAFGGGHYTIRGPRVHVGQPP